MKAQKCYNLTLRQENFCLAYVETGNATEAYRRSYSWKNMKESTLNRRAKFMIDHNKIKARIEELREPIIEKVLVTFEGHLSDLKELRDKSVKAKQFGSAVTAEVSRGKAAGFYVDRHEVEDVTPTKEIEDKIGETIERINRIREKKSRDALLN